MSADAYRALTIAGGIRAAAARVGDKTAIVDGARSHSYRALARRSAQVAHLAREHLGLVKGDRVALVAPNCLEYVELVAGLSEVGVIVATLNPRLTAAELRGIVADCDPRAAFVHPSCARAIDEGPFGDRRIVVIDSTYEALLARAADRAPDAAVQETDPFALAYTSGTTGAPKGVLLSHRSRALTFLAMAAEYRCFGIDDRFLAMAPMCHGAGFVFACAALFFGGTTVLFPAGDPIALLDRLGERDVSGVFMVPTQFARLFDLAVAELDRRRTHALTTIISNAAALPQPLKERAIAQFGAGLLHETYGSTEGGIVTNIRPNELLARPGSVGRPFPGVEVALRTEDGRVVEAGVPGELYSRSATSFSGYWQKPGETAAAIVGGWVTVGDIASADADGFVTIVDRKKDMVVTGGINVYPREIENVIATLPGVREAAVIGRPSAEWGESLHAFVVPSAGATIDPAGIIAACRERLAGFKVPRNVSLIDELPRNASGKVLKSDLRTATYAEQGSTP